MTIRMNGWVSSALVFASLAATSCSALGEPQRSYCEALCDWAVSCAGDERSVDAAAETAACIADAQAIDPQCAAASDGSLNPVEAEALTPCVDAIDAAASAGECDGFTGSIDDLKVATTPAECAGQGEDAQTVFTTVQESAAETNDELCTRFSETFCGLADECIVGDFGNEIPQEAIDAAGGTPFDLCVTAVNAVTTECIDNDLYGLEEDFSDVNTARQAARECMSGFDAVTCEQVFSGEVPQLCAAAFTTTDQAVAFATAMTEVAAAFAQE
jgi:hypothetical protein